MTSAIHEAKNLVYPDAITEDEIQYFVAKGVHPDIAKIDFGMIKMKLKEKDEGLGWSDEQCESGELEYKRYLTMCLKFGKGMVPNKIMDNFWHYHILDTRAYERDCNALFGGIMHHYPYFGMRGEEDSQDLKKSFYKSRDLYEQEFGEPMAREEHTDCWHDCENRCWHACPSIAA
ncbi:hypothetical protein [Endozoicomonas sp. SCSIO W0465]|uniref:glycine-rich domain-containing protein n=1 Tax=Endozoicomonas sp. SCSIO W0465 TaxID=2918516 RepID=UPI002075B796|nr:hypothetical protein [Endozoicomonas sp. SCSIO W0465]USE39517.1 hypothetical protein MJO57_15945 [Endozoicomonas sp. SCSIO W0465]